ncbi:MAG TPA: sugar-transfer associated ATP-grasp domain-containing protein [Myxococcota bacterium]|nr:sugar-transfer associated ATP-grasp domain-containing protein [Myxococcota bacterium]
MDRRKQGPRFADVLRADIGRLTTGFRGPRGQQSLVYRMLASLLYEKRGRGRYKMRIFYCPPVGLMLRRRPRDASDASLLHAFWLAEAWRERGRLARLRLAAVLVLAWPVVTVSTALWFTAINGGEARRRTGKGRLRQLAEQLRMAAAYDVLPPWYYIFELFEAEAGAQAGAYLHRFETKGGLYRFVKHKRVAPGEDAPLGDKIEFAERCRERAIPTAPVLLVVSHGAFFADFGGERVAAPRLPETDLFVKQASGTGGLGAERWWFDGDGSYHNDDDRRLGHDAMLDELRRRSRKGPCLVQKRFENHSAMHDLCNGALSTVRITTIQDEGGHPEVTHAVLRMALTAGKPVDNFHAGGLAAPVDLHTGELGPASDVGLRPDVGWCDTHPATGAKLLGRRLPWWAETLELARRAHAAFPKRVIVGWDIAILEDGPVVIEGNGSPDLDIVQRIHHQPLGDGRFGALLAFHVRRGLAARG